MKRTLVKAILRKKKLGDKYSAKKVVHMAPSAAKRRLGKEDYQAHVREMKKSMGIDKSSKIKKKKLEKERSERARQLQEGMQRAYDKGWIDG